LKQKMKYLCTLPKLSTFVLLILAGILISCQQQSPPQPEPTAQSITVEPSEETVIDSISPISPPATPPASPLPTPEALSTLPAEFTGPLAEHTINNGIRADFISLPFYRLLVWTGLTWDGDDYVWIVNNELKAISGFNVKEAISDRLISFPFDLEQSPSFSGLTWDGTQFWVVDSANQMIYQLDLNGQRGEGFDYDGTPTGWVWIDDSLWVNSKDRLAIEKVSATGERQHSIPVQAGWPTGLAWDGKYFWYSDGQEGTISLLNPANGKIKQLDEIQFMMNRGTFNGLAWMNGYLWIATEADQRLHRLDVSQLDWETLDAALQ
jgi:hypothetical protein